MTLKTPAVRRAALALVVCTPPLVVYLMTMAPGLIARGDTPKFQYLGYILGTSHSPGYPLYVLLSWLFSQLPIGDVAWRVNFMTALFGALSGAAMFAAARELGASRGAAWLTAWGMAFGPVFWSQAMSAEVYTLAALLQLGVMTFVFRWQRTRRDRDLLTAVAIAALALGHHATMFMIAPSFALFVLLVDWRVLLRPRIVVTTIVFVLLGIGQDGYIVLRSFTGARYVEANARTPQQFFDMLRGRQYTRDYFGFTMDELLEHRSRLMWELIAQELTIVGVAFLLIGALWLLRRNWRGFVLLVAIMAPLVVFAMTYHVGDTPVFMIPVFLALWAAVAVGITVAVRFVSRGRELGLVAASPVAIAVLCVLVPRSYAIEDLSKDTFDKRYVAALLAQIQTPAIVYFPYDDSISHAVRYGLFIDDAARGPVSIGGLTRGKDPRPEWRQVPGVYVMEPARRLIEARGVLVTPVRLTPTTTEPLDMQRLPLFRAVGDAPCREATTNNWVVFDQQMMIGPRFTAWVRGDRIAARREDGLELTVVAGADRGMPAIGGYIPDGDDVEATLDQVDMNDAAAKHRLLAQLARDGMPAAPSTRFVTRATIPLPITEGGHANAVLGTAPQVSWFAIFMKSRRDMNVRYCGSPTEGVVLFGDPSISRVELARASGFATWGWHDVERTSDEIFRWTSLARPELQFNVLEPLPLKVVVDAAPARTGNGAHIGLEINGQALTPKPMDDRSTQYEWDVPAAMFRAGENQIVLVGPDPVTPKSMGNGDDTRPMSLRIRSVELIRGGR